MKQSESIKSLLASVVKAQGEFPTLPKDKSGYGYKYTDLDTVISTIRPILSKHSLAFVQSLTVTESGRQGITTRLFNSEGEWIEDTIALPDVAMAKTNAAQNLGAAITYMRRYALSSMLGVTSDEDTDAADIQQARPLSPAAYGMKKGFEPKPALKGGASTPQEQEKIKSLMSSTDKAGNALFSKEETEALLKSRQKDRTAQELIDHLMDEIAKRRGSGDFDAKAAEWKQDKLAEGQEEIY